MLDFGNEKIEFRHLDQTRTATVDRKVNIGLVFYPLDAKHHIEVITCAPGVYRFTPRKHKNLERSKGVKYYFETELVESYLPKRKPGRYD